VQDALVAEARLCVAAVLPEQQHVGQVRDVAGGQAQRLDLGELPVHGLGGNERAQRREGRVHAVRPVPLPRVGRLPLLARTAARVLAAAASPPPPPHPPAAPPAAPILLRLPAGAAVPGGLPVGAVAAAVQVGGAAGSGPHPGCRLELLEAGGRLHITLS